MWVIACAVGLDSEPGIRGRIAIWRRMVAGAGAHGLVVGVDVPAPEMDPYSPAIASNVGVRLACDSGAGDAEVVIKTDIDCWITSDGFQQMAQVERGRAVFPVIRFATAWGEWGTARIDYAPCGTAALTVQDWYLMQGYDERMTGHGKEDGDLYERALRAGIRADRPQDMVYHVAHPDRRGARYPVRRIENCLIARWNDWHNERWGLPGDTEEGGEGRERGKKAETPQTRLYGALGRAGTGG